MMTTNVRNMRSIVTASSAVLVALLAVVVMLSAVSGVSADKSTTTTYETTKYVDEYNSGYYGEEYKSGYYPKYKWWAPWTWKYSSNKYNDNKYDSGYDSGYSKKKYGSGYSKYDSGYGYSKYDSKYGVGPYYGKQYEQDEHYPCDTFYPKPKWYSPFTWKYRKYAKFDYYSVKLLGTLSLTLLVVVGAMVMGAASLVIPLVPVIGGDGGDAGGDGRRRQLLELSYPRPLYETQYYYAKSEAHGLTFTLTNHYYYNEKWVCAIDDISRKSAICTMAGHFGGGYSTPEKCILTFKTHQKGGKCIPHHMALDCGKPPVDFDFEFGGRLPNLAEVRFANWVTGPTGPGGFFVIADFGGQSSLTSIYAPRLVGTQSLEVAIDGNPMLTSVDLSALKEAGEIEIFQNENLKKINLPQLREIGRFFDVLQNPNLEKLCASKLESGGSVCIGKQTNQPFLDADLSELVDGNLFDNVFCSDSTAPTVCGPSGDGGLFSSTSGGCPSNACL
ncbi:Kin17_mid domain-containing protein [Pycnococcus provasolii]